MYLKVMIDQQDPTQIAATREVVPTPAPLDPASPVEPVAATEPDPVPTPEDAPAKEDPLQLLEKILSESKTANPDGGAATPETPAEAAPVPEVQPEGPTAEEVAVLAEERTAVDEVAAEAQLQEIKAEVASAQHQNQVHQAEATQQAETAKTNDQDGLDIHQLEHAKI